MMNHRSCERALQRVAILSSLTLLLAGFAEQAGADVLIVKSGDLPQYEAPIAAFSQRISKTTREITIDIDAQRRLRHSARNGKVEAIFALGGQAVFSAHQAFPEVPLVFAMVLNRDRVDVTGSITGVDVQLPIESLFTRFKLMMPKLLRLGIIHGPSLSERNVERIRTAAASLQIEAVTARVQHTDEVAGAYRRIRTKIDALWMVPDPVVVTRDNFGYLSHRSRHDGIAFLAFSENFVRAGALMSISPNYRTMGEQAAVLLERLLEDPRHPPEIQAPLGSRLVVNAAVASDLGLDTASSLLGNADTLINERR